MTLQQLAERIGVSRQAIYSQVWNRGYALPLSPDAVKTIEAHYLQKNKGRGRFMVSLAHIDLPFKVVAEKLAEATGMTLHSAETVVRRVNLGSEERRWEVYKRAFQKEPV